MRAIRRVVFEEWKLRLAERGEAGLLVWVASSPLNSHRGEESQAAESAALLLSMTFIKSFQS